MIALSQITPQNIQMHPKVMPCEWRMVTISEIAATKENAIVGGPFGSDLVSNDYVPYGVPVIRGQNMSGRFVAGDFVFVSDKKARTLKANTAVPQDIVFTQRGTLGQVSLVPNDRFDIYLVSQSQMKLTPDSQKCDPRFLLQYFSSSFGQRQIIESAIQTGVPHTNLGILRNYKVPLPPLFEQRMIADTLDEADKLIETLETLITKKRALKRGVADELLSGQRRMPGFVSEWGSQSFGEVFEFLPTATNSRADLNAGGDTYYIHYGDIHTRFHDHLNLRHQQPPRILRQKCRNAAYVCNGDWIMADASEDFDGVCKSVEVLGLSEGDKIVSGLHTFLLREKSPTFVPGFKGHLGNLKSLRDQYLRVMTGMKVFGVSKTALRDLVLPIPKPQEQEAIVSILSDMEADISVLEGRVAKARLIKQGMIQELLTGGIRLI